MALNSGLGGFSESVLLSFNIHDAQTASHNIVSILGTIGIGFDNPGDNISGLSIDPVSGNLYALHRDDDGDVLDSLFVLDKSDGSVLSSIGILSGSGQDVRSGEDLEFDRLGNLFVTDNADDHLYQVDPLTGSILSMIDSDEKDGISTSVKIEGLAWDFENDRLIASDDKRNLFAQLSLSDGANSSFGKISGLTDVEGIDFLPSSVPEPGSMLMLGLGLLAMGRKPRRG
ncbi:MAG: PEP-CTERM sorting domain-containing protein [bacterium]|nr:PEP-CTERM sorting domain-containing protein [bacterium]